jgi:hypothetical protein
MIMLDKNFIKIIFDKSVSKPVSLKELCAHPECARSARIEGSPQTNINLNLKIELQSDVKIHLLDDLPDLQDLACGHKIEHEIEIVLNEGALLEYHMHLRRTDGVDLPGQCDCEFNKNLKLNFVGQHSFAKVRMNCLGSAKQKFNFVTEQNHLVCHTSSCLRIKSVLLDGAKLDCKSKIFVQQDLQNVFAKQINKNLLLGPQACVSTTPQLEVLSDNVKCKHGATVKNFDEEQLCYLQSRGVPKNQAEQLLIDGFLN